MKTRVQAGIEEKGGYVPVIRNEGTIPREEVLIVNEAVDDGVVCSRHDYTREWVVA